MHAARIVLTLALLLMATGARSACTPIRIGYVNQHRPPYFLGNGSVQAHPPGAAVALLGDIAAAAGCPTVPVRLPPLRLRKALLTEGIDATLMSATQDEAETFALPLDKDARLDATRAVRMYTVVFVRAADQIGPETDPRTYFLTHQLGTNNGATLAAQLRGQGMRVDDGAHDDARNLEKLARGRIDGFAATMVAQTGMDAEVAKVYGTRLVRLKTPLLVHHFWLGFTKSYYLRNHDAVETMWGWMGAHADLRFAWHVEQYVNAALREAGQRQK